MFHVSRTVYSNPQKKKKNTHTHTQERAQIAQPEW